MRWIGFCLCGLLAVNARAGDCLSVRDNALDKIDTGYGMTTVEWSATVKNGCDAGYDGTLTVRLLDQEGAVLHETLEVIILEDNASEQVSKRITLPAESYKALNDIEVDIRERERPR